MTRATGSSAHRAHPRRRSAAPAGPSSRPAPSGRGGRRGRGRRPTAPCPRSTACRPAPCGTATAGQPGSTPPSTASVSDPPLSPWPCRPAHPWGRERGTKATLGLFLFLESTQCAHSTHALPPPPPSTHTQTDRETERQRERERERERERGRQRDRQTERGAHGRRHLK
eukprot:COSAG01_NODE_533_length_15816_cov_4.518738_22_plen_169_part_00